jgi:hypothetical protein
VAFPIPSWPRRGPSKVPRSVSKFKKTGHKTAHNGKHKRPAGPNPPKTAPSPHAENGPTDLNQRENRKRRNNGKRPHPLRPGPTGRALGRQPQKNTPLPSSVGLGAPCPPSPPGVPPDGL